MLDVAGTQTQVGYLSVGAKNQGSSDTISEIERFSFVESSLICSRAMTEWGLQCHPGRSEQTSIRLSRLKSS